MPAPVIKDLITFVRFLCPICVTALGFFQLSIKTDKTKASCAKVRTKRLRYRSCDIKHMARAHHRKCIVFVNLYDIKHEQWSERRE